MNNKGGGGCRCRVLLLVVVVQWVVVHKTKEGIDIDKCVMSKCGTRTFYSIDVSRNHGRKRWLLSIIAFGAGMSGPFVKPALPLDFDKEEDEDEDDWEELNKDRNEAVCNDDNARGPSGCRGPKEAKRGGRETTKTEGRGTMAAIFLSSPSSSSPPSMIDLPNQDPQATMAPPPPTMSTHCFEWRIPLRLSCCNCRSRTTIETNSRCMSTP